ncbi:putative phenylalanine aminotransferase [Streptomyces camponoticapitis]|uniref:Histidinol-phosphate aminotransferase n=1 Tax=Streptomyces camponoticapitis TaxID=1616125 RepID=A0ABQ2EXA7_9ACTN|nr:histidinol-phosphate transaminase [Streptomyces camponoticapitis]GGK29953.1 putative phenylalanine aminotransferase [Streptomyces camponoticapitis]
MPRNTAPGPRLRAVLDSIPGYRPTEGIYAAVPARPLSANESPHDPLPGLIAAIAAAGDAVNRYPDPESAELTRAIARRYGIDPDRVLVGAGSVSLLQAILQAVAEPGAEVVHPWRSFELYPVLAELAGIRSVPVPLTRGRNDLHALADRITDATRLVLVCNPNNPTGTVLGLPELKEFLARVPATCLVVIDEAYFEYVRDEAACSGIALLDAHPNLVVTRTFSKAYGLAGLRVGYLLGAPHSVGQLRKVRLAYSVSTVAQQAALAALRLEDELLRHVDATVAERARMRDALLAGGFDVPDSQGNFLWLPLGDASAAFGDLCTSAGIAVRTYAHEGVRVSVGSAQDNDAFLTVATRERSTVCTPQ